MRSILRATGRQAERQEVAGACRRAANTRLASFGARWETTGSGGGLGQLLGCTVLGLWAVGKRQVRSGELSLSFLFSVSVF